MSVAGLHTFRPDYPDEERRRWEYSRKRADMYFQSVICGLAGSILCAGGWIGIAHVDQTRLSIPGWLAVAAVGVVFWVMAVVRWRHFRQYRVSCIARDLS